MKLTDPLSRTLWDWLQIELRLFAIEYRGALYQVSYEFDREEDESPPLAVCRIYAKHTQTMIDEGVDRKEQLSYYQDWVSGEREILRKLAVKLAGQVPHELEGLFVYCIMYDYGMGANTVCEFRGDKVRWVMGPE